jgi:outer membrane PBP1 activator LpoA protein
MKVRRRNGIRRWLDRALAGLLVLWLPALSVAQSPGASAVAPAASAPVERLPAGDSAPPAPAGSAPRAAAPRDPVPLALVLPLESPLYGRAAEAVRAGFAAAAALAGTRYTVIAHGDGGVVAAFERALEAGARVVVGPLVRDDLKTIATARGPLPWTIALNQLDDGSALPARIDTLALAVESEGVQLARYAHTDGARTVAIIGSDSALQQRFAGAFTGEWILQGGAPPLTFRLDRDPEMLALLRREVTKAAPDTVLLAVDAADAILVRPYLGQVTAYTSSQVNAQQTPDALRDLEDVRFVEIPWLADPANPRFAGIPRPEYGSATLERLYALGIDAFRIGDLFIDGALATLEFDGATGHLTLDRSGQFLREGTLVQFRDGEAVPLGAR